MTFFSARTNLSSYLNKKSRLMHALLATKTPSSHRAVRDPHLRRALAKVGYQPEVEGNPAPA